MLPTEFTCNFNTGLFQTSEHKIRIQVGVRHNNTCRSIDRGAQSYCQQEKPAGCTPNILPFQTQRHAVGPSCSLTFPKFKVWITTLMQIILWNWCRERLPPHSTTNQLDPSGCRYPFSPQKETPGQKIPANLVVLNFAPKVDEKPLQTCHSPCNTCPYHRW